MAKYLHISFNFKSGKTKITELEPLFNTALDWARYAPNCWILLTTTDPDSWYKHIKEIVDKKDTFFICELNIENRSGWLPKNIWDWIKKKR